MANAESRPRINGKAAKASASARDLMAHGERLRDELSAVGAEVRDTLDDWRTLLRAELERQPYATLAVAAGVGYVLGGGVPPTLIRILLGVGGRLAADQLLARIVKPTSAASNEPQ